MKHIIKSTLYKAGLLHAANYLYFNLKSASPSTILREFRRGSEESVRFPLPPPQLMYDVIGSRWRAVFIDSGKKVVDDMENVLRNNGYSLNSFGSILDFGCGCGRLIRHLPQRSNAKLYGSDYNEKLVAWCRSNLPFANFVVNHLAPPLPFEDSAFDFVYARSVYTHLPEDLQQAWTQELHRVLRIGGVLYMTMHGYPLAKGLSNDQQAMMADDDLVVLYSSQAGENQCTTFASPGYVIKRLAPFTILDIVEGRDEEHLRQDIYLSKKA